MKLEYIDFKNLENLNTKISLNDVILIEPIKIIVDKETKTEYRIWYKIGGNNDNKRN